MVEIDYLQLALAFLGGSGVTGLVLAYWQTLEERNERARTAFRELILTPEFLRMLLVFQQLRILHETQETFKRERRASVFIKQSIIQITDQSQLDALFADADKEFLRTEREVIDSGIPLLIPERMRQTISAIHRSLDDRDLESINKQIRLLSQELREILGLRWLDGSSAIEPKIRQHRPPSSGPELDDTTQLWRLLVEHDVLSSLDAILLLLLPLTTFAVSITPFLLGLGVMWRYLAGFAVIAIPIFVASLVVLVRAKLAGGIAGRVRSLGLLVLLLAFGILLVVLWLTHLVRGGDILVVSLEKVALASFASAGFAFALASYPTKWLARTLKDRMSWRSDEIEAAFSSIYPLRSSYVSWKWVSAQCLLGSALLLAYVFL